MAKRNEVGTPGLCLETTCDGQRPEGQRSKVPNPVDQAVENRSSCALWSQKVIIRSVTALWPLDL